MQKLQSDRGVTRESIVESGEMYGETEALKKIGPFISLNRALESKKGGAHNIRFFRGDFNCTNAGDVEEKRKEKDWKAH